MLINEFDYFEAGAGKLSFRSLELTHKLQLEQPGSTTNFRIPFKLAQKKHAMWWFQLLMPQIRFNYDHYVYDYLRAYLQDEAKGEEFLKQYDETEQGLIKKKSSLVAHTIIQDGVSLNLQGEVWIEPKLGSELADLKQLFDQSLQFNHIELTALILDWRTQWKTLTSLRDNGTLDCDTRYYTFLHTHKLPGIYFLYAWDDIDESELMYALNDEFALSGITKLDLRPIAHEGIEYVNELSGRFNQAAREMREKSRIYCEPRKRKRKGMNAKSRVFKETVS